MRFYVRPFLQEPVGAQMHVELDMGSQHLAQDLDVAGIKGALSFLRTSEGILVRGTLGVGVDLECVRCLNPATHEIAVELDEHFFAPGPFPGDPSLFIDDEGYLDIEPVLRESVIVSIPMHVLCRPDCQGLCPECGQNLNEGPCGCQADEIDPRMAALQFFLNDGVEPR